MGSLVKSSVGTELPKTFNLLSTLRWWITLCFGIGLPLRKPRYGLGVKLFTLALLLCDLTAGLMLLIGLSIYVDNAKANSTSSQIASAFLHFNVFVLNSVFHAIMLWKLEDLRAIIQALNQLITVDLKLQKMLSFATALIFSFIAVTQTGITILAAAFSCVRVLNFQQWSSNLIWALWGASFIYPGVISYMITLLITALGYQFSLVKEEMETRAFISWEKLYQRHIELCKMAGKLQKFIDLPLTIVMGCTLVALCTTVYYITDNVVAHSFDNVFFASVLATAEYCMRCICLCVAADYLREQADSVALELAEADLTYLHVETPHMTKILRGFSINFRNLKHLTSFSVGGFCRLGKPLLLTMLAVAMTYYILLRQMR